MNAGRVIVFLKAPRPGFVKTRIAAQLDAEAAVAIYQVLVGMTLSRLRGRKDVELRYAPDDAAPELGCWRHPGWSVRPQGEGDLGDRICRATDDAFAEGMKGVVILGADCPEFADTDIDAAFAALGAHDVVLGPATDGGYWLVGMGRPLPSLFCEIPWSSDRVFETTRQRAIDSKLRVAELRRLRDIDTLEDWRTWLREHPL